MNIGGELFRYARTHGAYERVLWYLARLEELGANDRHATVEAALCSIAAELCQRVGRSDTARDLRGRATVLLEKARVASLHPLHRKRRVAKPLATPEPSGIEDDHEVAVA